MNGLSNKAAMEAQIIKVEKSLKSYNFGVRINFVQQLQDPFLLDRMDY